MVTVYVNPLQYEDPAVCPRTPDEDGRLCREEDADVLYMPDTAEVYFWMPPDASEQEEAYTAGYSALKGYLADVHVHLTARRVDQLGYRRLVALAG
ncbi:pantoate--beta-alanine ligase [Streptomyces sp. NPDC002886]|uniref:pantoate--beta-alanine ligase n=1 Tax=Streptomyces sp. NPDC002886 TaxID=3364667 RepID=UPI00368997CE